MSQYIYRIRPTRPEMLSEGPTEDEAEIVSAHAAYLEALAAQGDNEALAEKFAPLAKLLQENESQIVDELNGAQGQAMDIGGYYFPNPELAAKAMRPSGTLNDAIATLNG